MTAESEMLEKFDIIIELLQEIKSKLEEIEEHTDNINLQIADRES